eukprot:scaffold8204_cov177-Amphora_coffeaeformis.AAC.2
MHVTIAIAECDSHKKQRFCRPRKGIARVGCSPPGRAKLVHSHFGRNTAESATAFNLVPRFQDNITDLYQFLGLRGFIRTHRDGQQTPPAHVNIPG